MATLLEMLENAVLTFTRSGVKTGTDPETGNPIFAKSTFAVRAKLDQKREAPRDVERKQTGNMPAVWVEGYCVEPDVLPVWIAKNAVCDATISGKSGRLYLVPKLAKSAILAIEMQDLLGEEIRGWFELE